MVVAATKELPLNSLPCGARPGNVGGKNFQKLRKVFFALLGKAHRASLSLEALGPCPLVPKSETQQIN